MSVAPVLTTTMTADEFAANYMTAARYKAMKDVEQSLRNEVQRLQDVLRGYEKWEADLVLNGEWGGGQDGLPAMTYPQFDELMRLQSLRNEVLGK